ncbi:hypothetical protein HPB51_007117 [Rhipicephalus microplus]|uniref:FYVE-type domain-containing protein n=1 Tax=Rhipicephalus microplus TaxID=6941 RepID=A0A9J6DZ79_RHIMP|nr:hypothetical protein HPB51_007117 [Rhipicephalus microplus]
MTSDIFLAWLDQLDHRFSANKCKSGPQILDSVAMDYHVAVAGRLTDNDILSEVLEDQNNCSDDDSQDEPPSRHCRTVQEAAKALTVLEEFFVCSRNCERAQHHLMGLNKMVLSKILTAEADENNALFQEIKACHKCKKSFPPEEKKHHCRACGNGFCQDCSSKTRPVPERGWGTEPVRVCDDCFEPVENSTPTASPEEGGESELTARKLGEALRSTFGVVASAMEYPIGSVLGLIKDTARPAYWQADNEVTECAVCKQEFGPRNPIHHCRSCGRCVCNGCSTARRPVPSRGWEGAVRVCKDCEARPEL